MGEELKLNIGCGKIHFDGYVNIDISEDCKPDKVLDIREGLGMYKDDSVDEIIANGVLEMILPNEEFLFVLNELWRVIRPNGIIKGQVPSIDPRVLMLDPFDRRWFQVGTFNYWNYKEHSWREFGTQYGFKPWDVQECYVNDNGIVNFEMVPYK